MSTLPSVVSRFVEYYAALDSQPPSALVGLYHSNATLVDPFGEHDGIFALQRYFTICWPTSRTAVFLSTRRSAAGTGLLSPG